MRRDGNCRPSIVPAMGREEIRLSRSQMDLLRQYGIRPVKRRGQNFLIDGNLARWIAKAALALGQNVLELGAGAGAVTTHLLAAGGKVTAVEMDRRLCHLLRQEWGETDRFRLLEVDLGRLDWALTLAEAGRHPVVAGNLPYALTSSVLFGLAECRQQLAGAVLMVQKEVAERLTAVPGRREYGVLSVILGSLFAIEIIRQVPATVFWPRPTVASAVVKLVPAQPWPDAEYRSFKDMVKALFEQRRKKVSTLLRSQFEVPAADVPLLARTAGIDADARPEQLSPERLRVLAQILVRRKSA